MNERKRVIDFLFILLFFLVVGSILIKYILLDGNFFRRFDRSEVPILETKTSSDSAIPIQSSTATPSPTIKILTFSEMVQLYGPCTSVPVLMYHHVEPMEIAKENKRTGLNVPPDMFRKHMEYLKTKGYSTISPIDLANFFDNGTPLPVKPVMITFDDGYVDIGDQAFPIMREFGIKGVVYIPTGLMENNSYLTWAKISEMKSSGLITFGNHTWSHMNVGRNTNMVKKEIETADKQLSERGLNDVKTFVYPYGLETNFAENLLSEMGYKMAFTTAQGRVMCKKQRFSLPRIRVGNAPLSSFGI